jgi:hypothetical protein
MHFYLWAKYPTPLGMTTSPLNDCRHATTYKGEVHLARKTHVAPEVTARFVRSVQRVQMLIL